MVLLMDFEVLFKILSANCERQVAQEEDLRLLFAHVFQTCAVLLMLCFSSKVRSEPEAQLSVMLTL